MQAHNDFSSPARKSRRAIVVTTVRVCVRVPVTVTLCFNFFKRSYLRHRSSENIHIWNIGTFEGRSLSFHGS